MLNQKNPNSKDILESQKTKMESNHKTGVYCWRLQQIIVGEFAVRMGGVLYKSG